MKEINNLEIKLNLKRNKIRYKEELISILAIFIFDKAVVRTNKELYEILNKTLGVKYLEYVIGSRTLLFAKISREIYESEDKRFSEMVKGMESLLASKNTVNKKSKNIRKNSNNSLKLWMDGLNNDK